MWRIGDRNKNRPTLRADLSLHFLDPLCVGGSIYFDTRIQHNCAQSADGLGETQPKTQCRKPKRGEEASKRGIRQQWQHGANQNDTTCTDCGKPSGDGDRCRTDSWTAIGAFSQHCANAQDHGGKGD
jgi:hypothetical protein